MTVRNVTKWEGQLRYKHPRRHIRVCEACLRCYAFPVTALNSGETLQQWLAAINSHDVDGLAALMAQDHVFLDSLGNRAEGVKTMEAGWRAYFAMCPDYWVRADHILAEGDTALLAGEAGGTIDGASWQIPAAWKVVIRDGRVVEWRVYADNKPVYEIVARRKP